MRIEPHNAKAITSTAEVRGDRVMEPKWDGWRLLIYVEENGVDFLTRRGNSYRGYLPKHEAELMQLFPAGTVLDCEAMAQRIDEDGRIVNCWGSVQSILGGSLANVQGRDEHITLAIFDMMAHGGLDIRALPFRQRREALETILDGHRGRVLLTPQFAATDASYEALLASGYEGAMVKTLDAPYGSGKRGHGLFKMKPSNDIDAVILGYKPGENSFTGYIGALIFGDAEGNEWGSCSGMDWDTRVWLTENIEELVAKRQVFTLRYTEQMPTGGLRSPRFLRLRKDKAAVDCTLEANGLAAVAA